MGVTDALREIVLPKLERVQKTADGFMARCPAHEDNSPSLSLGYGTKHPVIFNCHAGCDPDDILKAMGLEWMDLTAPKESTGSFGKTEIISTYEIGRASCRERVEVSVGGEAREKKREQQAGRERGKEDVVTTEDSE